MCFAPIGEVVGLVRWRSREAVEVVCRVESACKRIDLTKNIPGVILTVRNSRCLRAGLDVWSFA